MGMYPMNSTTGTINLEPWTFLGVRGDHMVLIEGLALTAGGQLHVEGGTVRIAVVTMTSSGWTG